MLAGSLPDTRPHWIRCRRRIPLPGPPPRFHTLPRPRSGNSSCTRLRPAGSRRRTLRRGPPPRLRTWHWPASCSCGHRPARRRPGLPPPKTIAMPDASRSSHTSFPQVHEHTTLYDMPTRGATASRQTVVTRASTRERSAKGPTPLATATPPPRGGNCRTYLHTQADRSRSRPSTRPCRPP